MRDFLDVNFDYKPGLDGLRAVAVVLVLVFHSDLGWLPGGFLGVSVFFTLSGFLITSLIVSEVGSSGRLDLLGFWERRFRRLLPAALVTIAGVSAAGIWLSTSVEQSRLRGDAIASVLYVSNWRSILADLSYEEIFSTKSPLIHLWSLAIEEQMYIVIPLIVVIITGLGLSRRTIGWTALALSGISTVVGAVFLSGDRLYYGTDARAAELLIGVSAAAFIGPRIWSGDVRAPRTLSWLSIGALVVIVMMSRFSSTNSEWVYAGALPAFAVLSLACVIGSLVPGPMQAVFSLRPLVYIGKLSYGLYLFHWPIFTWIDEARFGVDGVSLFVVRLVVTAAITLLSYLLIEKPIRERRWLSSRRSFALVMAAATVFTVSIPLVGLRSLAATPNTDIRVLSTVPLTIPDGDSPSATGDSSDPTHPLHVLVIGDSTAENIARALATVDSIGVVSAGVLGCPLVQVTEVFDRPRASQETSYCPNNLEVVEANSRGIDLLFIVAGVANQWAHRSLEGDVVAPGSAQYQRRYDDLMEDLQVVLASRAVPIVVLDNPRTRADEAVLGDEPESHGAWREQIERWDRMWATVARINIDNELAPADSSAGREQRPDGVHLEEVFAAVLARTRLVPELATLFADLLAELDRIGCRVNINGVTKFDLEACRVG